MTDYFASASTCNKYNIGFSFVRLFVGRKLGRSPRTNLSLEASTFGRRAGKVFVLKIDVGCRWESVKGKVNFTTNKMSPLQTMKNTTERFELEALF